MRNILFLGIFFIFSQNTYAAVCKTYAERIYSDDSQTWSIGNGITTFKFPTNYHLTSTYNEANLQTAYDCDGSFLKADFEPSTYLSINSGTHRISAQGITFNYSNSTALDQNDINAAKEYISTNLSFELNFRPNVSSSTFININPVSTTNVLPGNLTTSSYTNSTNMLKYYNGGTGQYSVGILMVTKGFNFSADSPSIKIGKVLENVSDFILDLGNFSYTNTEGSISSSNTFTSSGTSTTNSSSVKLKIKLNFTRATCAIIVPSTLNLGATTQSYINEHSFARTADVPVNIACSNTIEARNIRVTVNDINTNNNDGILSNIADSATRSNAVIRLKHNDNTPIKLGEAFLFTPVMEGSGYKNWNGSVKAEIFRPSDISNVTLGLVQGQATFTMTYD